VIEKIDGSLISPLLLKTGEIKYTSMSGFTEYSFKISNFIEYSKKKKTYYDELSMYALKNGKTPLFEWCDKDEPIIIKHEKSQLTLLNIRDIKTGEYTSYEDLIQLSKKFNVPLVKKWENHPKNEKLLIKEIYEQKSIEGYVIIFEDGDFYKCKTNFYSCAHGISPNAKYINERAILKSIGLDVMDDVVSTLDFSKEKRFLIYKWRDDVHSRIDLKSKNLVDLSKKKNLEGFDKSLVEFHQNSNQNLTTKQIVKLFIVDVTMKSDWKQEKNNFLKWMNLKEIPPSEKFFLFF
jgi:T4 RnlA family RNA ligase